MPGKAVVFCDCVLVGDVDGDHPEAGTDEARTLKSFPLEELDVGKIRLDNVTGPDRNLISSPEEVLSRGVSGPLFTRVGISERGNSESWSGVALPGHLWLLCPELGNPQMWL